MKIISFTLGEQKRITFSKENSNGIVEAYQLNTKDIFRPEIKGAYTEAKKFLVEAFSIFKFAKADAVMINAISIQWDKDFPLMMKKVRFNITLANKGNTGKMVTSWINVTEKTQKLLNPIVDEIEVFVNGERAQGKLFTDDMQPLSMAQQREMADIDAVDINTTFHINDIVVDGAVQ